MSALSDFTYNISVRRDFKARVAKTSSVSQSAINADGPQAKEYRHSILLANGNNAVDGADQLYSAIIQLAASTSTTLDLTSFVDVAGRTAQSLARVKSVYVCLLGTAQDSSVGTACDGIKIDGTVANAFLAGLDADGTGTCDSCTSTPKVTIPNGGELLMTAPTAAGWTVDGTHKSIKFTNLDSDTAAAILVEIVGGTT